MKVKILFLSVIAVLVLLLAASNTSPVAASHYCPGLGGLYITSLQAIARADSGDTIEMTSMPWLMLDPNYYDFPSGIDSYGSGTFIHKDPAGNIVRSGTWTAESLVIMKEYGCDEDGNSHYGGRAVIKVHLVTSDGFEYTGHLDIESPVGHPPPNALEGIRLKVGAWGLNFNQPISGFTLFSVL